MGMKRIAIQGSGRVRFSSSRRMTTDQTAPVRWCNITQASAPTLTLVTNIKPIR